MGSFGFIGAPHGVLVRRQILGLRENPHIARQAAETLAANRLHGNALHKIRSRQPGTAACPAGGGKTWLLPLA